MDKKIILIGFMGSGKTEVGSILADKLNLLFADLDKVVENHMGMPVTDIFRARGEVGFRQAEFECLEIALRSENLLLSAGGGIVCYPPSLALLSEFFPIFLDTPFEICYKRIKNDKTRPLAAGSKQGVKNRYEERLPLYRNAAKLTIDGTLGTPEDISLSIVRSLEDTEESRDPV